jgi:hypothetical protein
VASESRKKRDPTNWRAKVLLLYRTILRLREENKILSREVRRLERKLEKYDTRSERKNIFITWVQGLFSKRPNEEVKHEPKK